MSSKQSGTHRVAAIVGPYLSGKTSLLESILFKASAIKRKGNVKQANMTGDGSVEAKTRQMSTEVNIASFEYLGDGWTILDCPGAVELSQETRNALMVVDMAIVVVEPDTEKVQTVAPLLKFLDLYNIPHIIFLNKIEVAQTGVRATLDALQTFSAHPLVMREIPIRSGGVITGHIDIVSERAFEWHEGKPSSLVQLPEDCIDREAQERNEMLESLADFNDDLLEELLEDIKPSTEEIYDNIVRDVQENLIVPVFFGSGEQDFAITRLLKALRHESPGVEKVVERLDISGGDGPAALVFKTLHAGHAGRLSLVRVLSGTIDDGMTLAENRVSGIYRIFGQKFDKCPQAKIGEVVALGRLDDVNTGDVITAGAGVTSVGADVLPPMYAMAIHVDNPADEVRLMGALNKLIDEDPSLGFENSEDTNDLLLLGQGELHLSLAVEKMQNRFSVAVKMTPPKTAYKETIQKPTSIHARHKKQSGGHGEFGDVHIDIKPLPRGSGFEFSDSITGGAVPKKYIPAVEAGVREALMTGPLGYPVIDLAVTLTDGQHHNVDSSEMAFRKAAGQAIREGLAACNPVLLEPIFAVDVSLPSEFSSKVQRLISGRRGQILGFDAKPDWEGWDVVSVHIPEAEMHDLIIELRSMTLGVGTFTKQFDHLQEQRGK